MSVWISMMTGKKFFIVDEQMTAHQLMTHLAQMPHGEDFVRNLGNIFRERFAEEDLNAKKRRMECEKNRY